MNEEELKALVEILNRAPVSQAERFWLQGIVSRLVAALPEKQIGKSHESTQRD